jgi:hypothetical protein
MMGVERPLLLSMETLVTVHQRRLLKMLITSRKDTDLVVQSEKTEERDLIPISRDGSPREQTPSITEA